MKRLALLATVAGVIGFASPALASTQLLGGGSFSAAGCTPDCVGTFAPPAPESAGFSDVFLFQVTGSNVVLNDESATNAITVSGQTIANWTLDVFHNAAGNNTTFTNGGLVPGSAFSTSIVGSNQLVTLLQSIDLAPGFYGVETTGTVGGVNTAYSGSFSFAPTSAVPEPSTWALMLLGFVGLGWAFRRQKVLGLA